MEVNTKIKAIKASVESTIGKVKSVFVSKSEVSKKSEYNFKTLRIIGVVAVIVFVVVALVMPDDRVVEFEEKAERVKSVASANQDTQNNSSQGSADLWNRQRAPALNSRGGESVPNYDAPMVVGGQNGNSKTAAAAGKRIALRILDKLIISQESVPLMAEQFADFVSESGLKIPAGTKYYGEASFERGQDRANIKFKQISLPSGQIRKITAIAVSKDGYPGIPGNIKSDELKNTTGQLITSFVGGYAAGAISTNFSGGSQGGVQNGLLSAVAATAKDHAQAYGDKLKNEREWMEIPSGFECDALITESLNLQQGGANE
jgi:hypothetical protein